MLLEIDDWRTVGDLQYRFNKCFANLQLLVYDASGKTGGGLPVAGTELVEMIRKKHEPGVLSIKSWYTCGEVTQLLAQHHGIKVQIVPLPASSLNGHPQTGSLTIQEFNALAAPEDNTPVRPAWLPAEEDEW